MRTLLKEIVKQEGSEVVEPDVGSFSYSRILVHREPTPVDTYSVNFDVLSKALKKAKLPDFKGNDLIGWLTRFEKFFEIQSTKSEMKVPSAFVYVWRVLQCMV